VNKIYKVCWNIEHDVMRTYNDK